jgi:predicted CoA-binding protein
MNVAVVGASDKPERYSYRALKMLKEKGHVPLPVHPTLKIIDGVPVFAALTGVPGPVDVVTLYVSRAKQAEIADEIVQCRPRRVIFNPGAENPELANRLRAEGIESLDACTLVLLKTGQF